MYVGTFAKVISFCHGNVLVRKDETYIRGPCAVFRMPEAVNEGWKVAHGSSVASAWFCGVWDWRCGLGLRSAATDFTGSDKQWKQDRLNPSGNYMYHQFNVQQFYVLPTQTVFMCFVWI